MILLLVSMYYVLIINSMYYVLIIDREWDGIINRQGLNLY